MLIIVYFFIFNFHGVYIMFSKIRLYRSLFFILSCVAIEIVAANNTPSKSHDSHEWEAAERKAKNAVVQVIAQTADFNWLSPYALPLQKQGAGSGFFISRDGYLLTNFHVVDQAKSLQIYIQALGRKRLDVTVVGVCPEIDIALLKITQESAAIIRKELGQIPFLNLGNSENLKPVEPILALGYPLGQRYIKGTVGVLGGREYLNGMSYMHITAPINPGNSGGPLLNRAGDVVGITTAGFFLMGDFAAQNMGYIVPINYVKIILNDLRTKKLVRKPTLGISVNPTTEEHAHLLNNPWPAGVYVNSVQAESIAYKAGICLGDMLYKINGYTIDQFGDVAVNWKSSRKVTISEFLAHLSADTKLTFTIYRNGQKKELLTSLSTPTLCSIRYVYPEWEPKAIDFEIVAGLCIMSLRTNHFKVLQDTYALQYYKRPNNNNKDALVIASILPGSYAQKIHCFYDGDVLHSVNGKLVTTLADLRAALKLSEKTQKITITTKDKVTSVFALDKLFENEKQLTENFKYTTTKAIQALKEKNHIKAHC
jgi:serine protease Do